MYIPTSTSKLQKNCILCICVYIYICVYNVYNMCLKSSFNHKREFSGMIIDSTYVGMLSIPLPDVWV